ncbi:hypothetical protein MGALJ_19690 [Mycobacterium gallinarum]|uniref:DUF732 domain-containing protein n=1 Tax=Mycobacterium gallinarum TaxID=39689 RepID=A0A9W4B7D1_9MYCO|nr:hypothetical protein [Mycobacterium gallinarum]BBY92300.1 hypothetical protein MGALJ_19690 [Mycobacterium gallinarum]
MIDTAIRVYCPKYAAAESGPAPKTSAGPTYAEGDAFTEEVYDHGILQDLDPSHVVQILANICYHADGGVPTNSIVGLYINGYALSEKDAEWLVGAAQGKCD